MPETPKLDVDITEKDLTAALMMSRSPVSARAAQDFYESNVKYYKAFLRAWADAGDRVLESAAERARLAAASPTLEEQSRLVGQQTVEGSLRFAEECARLSHQCMALCASMFGGARGGAPGGFSAPPAWPAQAGGMPPGAFPPDPDAPRDDAPPAPDPHARGHRGHAAKPPGSPTTS